MPKEKKYIPVCEDPEQVVLPKHLRKFDISLRPFRAKAKDDQGNEVERTFAVVGTTIERAIEREDPATGEMYVVFEKCHTHSVRCLDTGVLYENVPHDKVREKQLAFGLLKP